MLTSILDDVKRQFRSGNMVTRLIIINVVVFVVINLVHLIFNPPGNNGTSTHSAIYTHILHFFCMSSDAWHILTHPWVIITSVFLHEGFMHILFNMLFLYWFGRIVSDLVGNHRILPLYILGGIAGGIIYFITANLLPYGADGTSYALGASAGVMAIVVASGVLAPEYQMNLLLIGAVKLKYIVLVLVFLDLIGTTANANTGGSFAHLGGAAFGYFFVHQMRNGNDMSLPFNNFIGWITGLFRPSDKNEKPRKVKAVYKNKGKIFGNAATDKKIDLSHQEQIDSILEKIKKNGYDSLSDEEKEFLFRASKKK